MSTWAEYQRLARDLDELAYDHEQRNAALASAGQSTIKAAEDLRPRLDAQRERLEQVGRIAGQRIGQPPATFTGVTDPTEALRLAREYLSALGRALDDADRYAEQPALLPGFPAGLRNLLVYLGTAALAGIAQYLLLLSGQHGHLSTLTALAWSYAGFPAIAWIGGYLVISVWGRPRTGDAASGRGPRLGFLLCFLAMPVFHLIITTLNPHLG